MKLFFFKISGSYLRNIYIFEIEKRIIFFLILLKFYFLLFLCRLEIYEYLIRRKYEVLVDIYVVDKYMGGYRL